MRLLIIGLGTAGSRIADAIIQPSDRSLKSNTIHAITVDNDPDVLTALRNINDEGKFYFPRDDVNSPELLTTNFTIDELSEKIKTFDNGQYDAFLLCAGLGGGLIDLVSHLVSIIRESMFEPIFGLFTLPLESEGDKRLKLAITALEEINQTLDGVIIFDNELWYERALEEIKLAEEQKPTGFAEKLKARSNGEKIIHPFQIINNTIARRIRMLVDAGEIQGEIPETVLDTREILNTITGGGYIAIGLSEDELPDKNLRDIFKSKEPGLVHRQEKAGRIIRLAERSIFREISTNCDLTTAKKALILLSGPEEELSMKGFMAVRKWLDESIDGFELRSGDFPISPRQAQKVSVLIVLSGLTHIERIENLKMRFLNSQ